MAYRTTTTALGIVAVLATAAVCGAAPANTLPHLGRGCQWKPDIGPNIQRCTVYSPSNNRNFNVDFRIQDKHAPVLDLYEGLKNVKSSNPTKNGLQGLLDISAGGFSVSLAATRVNIVSPAVHFNGTLQADAETGTNGAHGKPLKIRTFYLKEIPAYMKKTFGISPKTRRIGAGVSMGAAGLASTNAATGYYSDVLLLSGIYNFSTPYAGRVTVNTMAQNSGADPLYVSEASWQKNDPANPANLQKLKNTHVTMQAATGVMNVASGEIRPIVDTENTVRRMFIGSPLEVGSFACAQAYLSSVMMYAPQYAKNIHFYQSNFGVHSWENWRYSLYGRVKMLRDFISWAGIDSSHIIDIPVWSQRTLEDNINDIERKVS